MWRKQAIKEITLEDMFTVFCQLFISEMCMKLGALSHDTEGLAFFINMGLRVVECGGGGCYIFNLVKVKSMQRSGTEAIKIQPSNN